MADWQTSSDARQQGRWQTLSGVGALFLLIAASPAIANDSSLRGKLRKLFGRNEPAGVETTAASPKAQSAVPLRPDAITKAARPAAAVLQPSAISDQPPELL